MPRRISELTNGLGGINQNTQQHDSSQLRVATNVWAPNGIVETRPGVWPTCFNGISYINNKESSKVAHLHHCDNTPTPRNTFTNAYHPSWVTDPLLPVTYSGDEWYFTIPAYENVYVPYGIDFYATYAITSDDSLYPSFSYSDGTQWLPLMGYFSGYMNTSSWGTYVPNFNSATTFVFCPPKNMSATIPAGSNVQAGDLTSGEYIIRLLWLKVTGGSDTQGTFWIDRTYLRIDGPALPNDYNHVVIRNIFAYTIPPSTTTSARYYLLSTQCQDSAQALGGLITSKRSSLEYGTYTAWSTVWGTYQKYNPKPIRMVQVPDSDIYYTDGAGVYKKSNNTWVNTTETSSAIVGTNAPYSTSYIAQEMFIPVGSCVEYALGRLWIGDGSTFWWSAPAPYHNVWPTLSHEVLPSSAGKITAIRRLGQHVAIFTEQSIYRVTPSGQDDFGLLVVSIDEVVSGIGCVAQNSIAEVDGRLIFLSENGIHAYDGSPNVIDVTIKNGVHRISELLQSVSGRFAPNSCAVNWKSKKCYLLSVPLAGEQFNSKTICWDYANNTLWVWDLPANAWCLDNQDEQEEILYLSLQDSFIYKLSGNTDYNVQIPIEVMTHNFGDNLDSVKTFRSVEVKCSPSVTNSSVSMYYDGETETNAIPVTVDFSSVRDPEWPTPDGTEWSGNYPRLRVIGTRKTCNSMAVRITTGESARDCTPFRLNSISTEYIEGSRPR
jgi:hypothetical protein